MRSRMTALLSATAALIAASPASAAGVLALGDSYSSGQGAGAYDRATTGGGNTCWRSGRAWPQRLAQRLGLTALPSLACDGARTPEVVTSDKRRNQVERRVSQLSRIAGSPEIVTITIGGNDVGFASVLRHCVAERNCVKRYARPTGDLLLADIRNLERELPGVYRAIQAAAPTARVVVVGYPRLFPRAIPRSEVGNCAAWNRISSAEVRYLNARTGSLNEAIRRAAVGGNVGFVDVAEAFDGRELRCTGGGFVNRLRLRAGVPPYQRSSFHPTAAGHERIAEVVAATLQP